MNAATLSFDASTSSASDAWMWRLVRRIALTGIALAAAGVLLEWPRVTMLIWPVPISVLTRLAVVQVYVGLAAGLTIGACLECFWWLRDARRSVTQRIMGVAAIVLMPLLCALVVVEVPVSFRSVVFEYGLAGSVQAFYLFALWRQLTVAVIAVIYLARKRQIFAEDTRIARANREWEFARRSVLESRLQAIQARVEPQLLFDALSSMRERYQVGVAEGEVLLEALTDFLRCGLPQMRSATGTVSLECELLRSYAVLLRAAEFSRPILNCDVEPEVAPMTIAAGGLQGIVAPWLRLANKDELFEIVARRTRDGVRIIVTGPATDVALATLATQNTLREIHGSRSSVTQRESAGRLEVRIEYPDDIDQPVTFADGSRAAPDALDAGGLNVAATRGHA